MLKLLGCLLIVLTLLGAQCKNASKNTSTDEAVDYSFILDKRVKLDPKTLSVGGSFLSNGVPYDKDLIETMFGMLKENSVLFDIGANTGSFSLLAKFRNIKVHAFEPNPQIVEILKNNILLNGLLDKVTIHTSALSDTNGRNFLRCPIDEHGQLIETGLATLGDTPLRFQKYKEIPIDSIKLDDFVREHSITKIDFMKIDTEGYELNILRGGVNSIKRFHPILFLEFVEKNMQQAGHTPKELMNFLTEELKYSCTQISVEDLLCRHT